MLAATQKRQELVSGFLLHPETAQHAAGRGGRSRLLHATAHHAHVGGLDHHGHSAWFENLAECHGDLLGQPLLHLEPAGVHFGQSGKLREPNHPLVWDVGDVSLPKEGNQVVLTQRVDFDVSHNHHFVVVLLKNRPLDHVTDIVLVTLGEVQHCSGVPFGGFQKSLPVGVFSKFSKDGFHGGGYSGLPGFCLFRSLLNSPTSTLRRPRQPVAVNGRV